MFNDMITDHKLDVLCLTETWLKPDEYIILNESTPQDYCYKHEPRPKDKEKGVSTIYSHTHTHTHTHTRLFCNMVYKDSVVYKVSDVIICNNNNWLHLYSAFLDTQSALHSKGAISSSTTNVQHPPG